MAYKVTMEGVGNSSGEYVSGGFPSGVCWRAKKIGVEFEGTSWVDRGQRSGWDKSVGEKKEGKKEGDELRFAYGRSSDECFGGPSLIDY